jgi:hypothetical protein
MMKEMWIAHVHLLTPPSVGGNTKCCTNVVAWASNPMEYKTHLASDFEQRHWSILSVYGCKRVAHCIAVDDELVRQIERAGAHPDHCVFGTLHYYPSRPC